MERTDLVEEATRMMQQPLAALGYALEVSPPARAYEFWFEKKPAVDGEMYLIIELQPSGFGREELFDLAVNLARRPFRDFDDSRNYTPRNSEDERSLHVRLAPCLWEQELAKRAMDNWWHFDNSIEKLRIAYADILEKLLSYGIPFLENLSSTWFSWAGEQEGA